MSLFWGVWHDLLEQNSDAWLRDTHHNCLHPQEACQGASENILDCSPVVIAGGSVEGVTPRFLHVLWGKQLIILAGGRKCWHKDNEVTETPPSWVWWLMVGTHEAFYYYFFNTWVLTMGKAPNGWPSGRKPSFVIDKDHFPRKAARDSLEKWWLSGPRQAVGCAWSFLSH